MVSEKKTIFGAARKIFGPSYFVTALTPIVSRSKIKWYEPKKVKKLALNSQLLASNFDKRCSGAHFVSFLSYYYCKTRKYQMDNFLAASILQI